jgi:hypothetical protein
MMADQARQSGGRARGRPLIKVLQRPLGYCAAFAPMYSTIAFAAASMASSL